MNCTNCGAVPTREALQSGNCSYCKAALPHEIDAAQKAAVARELLADRNQNGIPDIYEPALKAAAEKREREARQRQAQQNWQAAQHVAANVHAQNQARAAASAQANAIATKTAKVGMIGTLVSGVFALLLVGGIAVAVLVANRAKTSTSASRGAAAAEDDGPPKPTRWSSANPGCPVDADGDKVGDFVGMAAFKGSTATALTIVDGRNGDVTFRGKPYQASERLACLDERWVVVSRQDFTIDFVDVRKPDKPLVVKGRDRLRTIGLGDGCAAYETADGSKGGVKLPGGQATTCRAREMFDPNPHRTRGQLGMTSYETRIKDGAVEYVLSKRRRGTPMLSIAARVGGRESWKRELGYQSPSFGTVIESAGQRLFVVGKKPGQRQMWLVAIDKRRGEERFAAQIGASMHSNVNRLSYNGTYLIVQYGVALEAVNPESGTGVWKIGH